MSKQKRKNTALILISAKIKALENKTITNIVEIGRLLHEASEQCEHGEFLDWLEENFGWSHDTFLNYRNIFELSQNPNVSDFDKLDISLTALYMAARLMGKRYVIKHPDGEAAGLAIIEAAKHGRVSHRTAFEIAYPSKPPIEPTDGEPDDDEPGDDEPDDEAPGDDEAPPPSDVDIKDKDYQDWLAEASVRQLVKPLERLDELLRQQDRDWAKAIKAVGPGRFREIVNGLKAALDQYNSDKAIKAKADAAEARRGLH
jgi:hypothetical protein